MKLWLIQFRGELLKLFARKRSYMGFLVFLVFEMLMLFLLGWEPVRRGIIGMIDELGYAGELYFSGLTLAFFIILSGVFLLGSLYLAMVASDVVGKEIEDGTLGMMLCRPVSRSRILVLKVAAIALYTMTLILFVSLTTLCMALLHSGPGGLFVYAPIANVIAVHEFMPGLGRYGISLGMLSLSSMTVISLTIFFSCLNMKPAAATVGTLSLLMGDLILQSTPFFAPIKNVFLSARLSAWVHVMEQRLPWEKILEDYAWLLAINATLLVLAHAIFMQRDFKT